MFMLACSQVGVIPGTISRAADEELNMDYFRNPMGPVDKAMRDYGIDMRNVHDVVMVGSAEFVSESVSQAFGRRRT